MRHLSKKAKQDNPVHNKRSDDGKPELSMYELLKGMASREFFFHYQPIFDLVSQNQVGSEMLIRWTRQGEVLAPMWFMPMIERHGLTRELDRFVIDCFSGVSWAETVKPNFQFRVFINISAQSFIDQEMIRHIGNVAEKMRENSIIPVLEISERTGCEISMIKEPIERLHENGVEIALDDFGVGFSSLSRLIELPVDILKIDRSITRLLGRSTRAETTTRHVFRVAEDLAIKVIAEGVETEEQSNWLVSFGPCWVQGFYYARPSLDRLLLRNQFQISELL